MRLSDLKTGEEGVIVKVFGRGAFRKRIIEMGFVKGQHLKVIKNAPLKDPVQYKIMGYEVSLRRHEASHIEVISVEEAMQMGEVDFQGVIDSKILKQSSEKKGKEINIALVGNPNAGKTTLFNRVSGAKEHTGNYSGVTVGAKSARFVYDDYVFNIVDLPGTYSLSAYTPEEIYVREYIVEQTPDIVVNVIDASNLERNLYLTTQLIDLDIKVVTALNMYDELERNGDKFDYISLGKMIGIPFVPTVASKGKGLGMLFERLIEVYRDNDPTVRHIHINYGESTEKQVSELQDTVYKLVDRTIVDHYSTRYLAVKLIEKDPEVISMIEGQEQGSEIIKHSNKCIKRLEKSLNEDSETIITDARYGFIAGALKETFKGSKKAKNMFTTAIDNFLTDKILGFPIFLFLMWLMFFSTFTIGQYPMEWIEIGVEWLSEFLNSTMAEGSFKDLLVNGIISGVGSVLVFLPNILILFLFISIFEDTGYMARAAFIMDKIMHKIGLHGKSFIPLIMGFGCNVPAIMSTRIIENKNNRILTILITPFMSCSARLPVYLLIIGAFFTENPGTVLFLVYLSGIALATIVAIVFNKTLFRKDEEPFVMELPPYRIPTVTSVIKHMWSKAGQYLKKMGGVILVAVIIIWTLSTFPKNSAVEQKYDKEIAKIENRISNEQSESVIADLNEQKRVLNLNKRSELQENSYIGQLGHFVEPAIRPLGFDWRMGVSLFTGVAAKEIVVSTMGVIYHVDDSEEAQGESLGDKLKTVEYSKGELKGKKVFTPLVAISFLAFILIYFPCVAVVAAIKKETGSWKWAMFTVFFTTGLAWLVSFAIFQIGSMF
ncbi:MAG: ferrous iron transport protein B [Bacteroidales bacterium]|jgi:ferrous iron transport protein B|nr:ferrous iron transport protein B [Bacteroidales bacterium]